MPDSFIWYELSTSDLDAAAAFYARVVGWKTRDIGQSGMRYLALEAQGRGVGGMAQLPADQSRSGPRWMGYIKVADVDATAARIASVGGAISHGPGDIPGVGRFATVADPQGAPFMLLAPKGEGQPALPLRTPGTVGWHELHTTDSKAAQEFYLRQFGWEKARDFDMGPMGLYAIFGIGGVETGGMMNNPDFPRPSWLYYFNVPEIHIAIASITANGGAILHGPHEVPGGDMVVQARDPQGAMFALTSPKTRSES